MGTSGTRPPGRSWGFYYALIASAATLVLVTAVVLTAVLGGAFTEYLYVLGISAGLAVALVLVLDRLLTLWRARIPRQRDELLRRSSAGPHRARRAESWEGRGVGGEEFGVYQRGADVLVAFEQACQAALSRLRNEWKASIETSGQTGLADRDHFAHTGTIHEKAGRSRVVVLDSPYLAADHAGELDDAIVVVNGTPAPLAQARDQAAAVLADEDSPFLDKWGPVAALAVASGDAAMPAGAPDGWWFFGRAPA